MFILPNAKLLNKQAKSQALLCHCISRRICCAIVWMQVQWNFNDVLVHSLW